MKRNIAYILGVMLLAASCISEQGLDVNSTRKDEVNFVADMKNAVTRTLYGADNATTIKVKWVNGDQIKVFGTNCAVSTGEYQITEAANKPNEDGSVEESKADALVRMGEVGVQWGSEKTSDFVAVYPAENASFQYNSTSGVVTATTTISSTQNYVFNDKIVTKVDKDGNTIKVWEGTHFANDATNPSMQNAIMYARTDEVAAGKNVSLSFEPYSTVLKFRFEGFESLWSEDAEAYIQSITITAPQGYYIAGDFDIAIPRNKDVSSTNPVKATSKGTGSNTITINTIKSGGAFLKVKENEAVEFNVFTVPLSGLTMVESNPWTVTINVQGMDPLVYKMLPSKDGGYTLVPGLIHKVKVPKMVTNTVPEWNPENWITQIPKEVYVSELSVPGAWYCFDGGYQNTTDLAALYAAGVRAFNLDCRIAKKTSANDHWLLGDYGADAEWSDSDYPSKAYLACAGTEGNTGISIPVLGSAQNLEDGIRVSDAMEDIVDLAQAHPNEYVVVVFTFAEKPKDVSGYAYGSVRPDFIMKEIYAVLETYKNYIYTGITKDTPIRDITKKQSDGIVKNVIVKINHCTDNFYSNSIYSGYIPAGIMGSFGSMSSNSTYNTASDNITNIAGLHNETAYADYFTTMRFNDIYNGTVKSDMIYCYHQAQHTTSSQTRGQKGTGNPSLGMRMDAIDDIIAHSKSVYDNAEHNHWFQMGIGGSLNGDNPAGVSQVLNPYLYGKIVDKMNTDPSPVGIVLMNHATNTTKYTVNVGSGVSYTASSQDLVKAIIEMNGKFYLNRQGNDVITGDGTQTQELETKAAAYVGPDAF